MDFVMKKKKFFKLIAFLLIFALMIPLAAACDDDGDDDESDDEGFNPYPYEDLSVYMDLPDYKNFTIKRDVVDKLVNAELMAFCQNNNLTTVLSEGTAQKYDYVHISYNGKIDGQTFDGGVSDSYWLLLGSDAFIEGFEDGCEGMTVGETRHLKLKFPEDYGYKQYAGVDVVFSVTLKEIERMPELTDAQCAQYSIYDTKAEFMNALSEHCVFDYEWQTLMGKCTLKGYPDKEYTEYYQYYVGFFTDMAKEYGMTLTEFLALYGNYYSNYGLWKGMTEAQFRGVADNYAKSNLVNDLLTYSIMRAENIKIEGAEWDAAVKILENEHGNTFAQIAQASGETEAIISVLTIRISNILYGYATIVD